MSVALLADAHLGGPGGSAGPLVRQLEQLAGVGCTHLVLMGDLFQVWVGEERFETPDVRATLMALDSLHRAGIRLSYVEGNRDFFLERSRFAYVFDDLGTEVAFEEAGRRYLAVHGDGLNERDWQYRFWRWLSKSRPARFFVGRLPRRVAHRAVHGTERRLAGTNFKHKKDLPEAAIRRYGEKRLAEGYDVLLLGHFHEPHRYSLTSGDVRILDAWYESRSIEWLDGSVAIGPDSGRGDAVRDAPSKTLAGAPGRRTS